MRTRSRLAVWFQYCQVDSRILFWILVGLLALLKLALTADFAVEMSYSPHDDSLYASRAYYLLRGEAFGLYDGRLLGKLPGISLWVAGSRMLGIPYLLSINLFYIFAGVYFIAAVRRAGYENKALLFGAFVLYLFNPVTFEGKWFRVLREPLSINLLVLLLAGMVFILSDIRDRKIPLVHTLLLSAAFAFSVLVREEDRLLYGLLLFFFVAVFWLAKSHHVQNARVWWVGVAFVVALPVVASTSANAMMRSYVAKHYGFPLVYDFGEGEYPKLIAAIRGIQSKKDNRLVPVTQEALAKLRAVVPRFAPVIDRLPPPGPESDSCKRFRVCSEWTGWMLFWIKDAAHQAGFTPTSTAAQAYFRGIRLEIEKACNDGRLTCRDNGQGLVPPFELRWTRAYVHEAVGIVKMMFTPTIFPTGKPFVVYPLDVELGRMFQAVTMTPYFDSALQLPTEKEDDRWENSRELYLSLKYWLRYPDVANDQGFGPGKRSGATMHYQKHGRHEGRVWEEKEEQKVTDESPYHYRNPLASWRPIILGFYEKTGLMLELAGILAFLVRLFLAQRVPLSPLVWVAGAFYGYTLFRLAVMAYVSVFMGGLDGRLFFSNYVMLLSLAPLLIFDAVRSFREYRRLA